MAAVMLIEPLIGLTAIR